MQCFTQAARSDAWKVCVRWQNAVLRYSTSKGKVTAYNIMLEFQLNFLYKDPMEFISRRNDGTEIKIKIRLSSEVSVHDSGYNQVIKLQSSTFRFNDLHYKPLRC